MKEKIPAVGIMKTNSKHYKISCDCGNDAHDISVVIESDETGINLEMYMSLVSNRWIEPWPISYNENWIMQQIKYAVNSLLSRASLIWKILTKGYIEVQGETILTKQEALNFSATINQAIYDVREFNTSKNTKDVK